MERRANEIELHNLWNNRYLWKAQGVPINELDDLSSYLNKAIEYDMRMVSWDICLKAINEALDRVKKTTHVKLDKAHKERIRNQLINGLSNLKGYEEQKKQVLAETKVIFEKI